VIREFLKQAKLGRQGRRDGRGQAMLIVIGLISVMVAVPVAINVLAVGQNTTSQEAALVIQAKQAASAGISDYINHLQAFNAQNSGSSYTQFCSNGVGSNGSTQLFPTCSSTPPAVASGFYNPAFVATDTPTNGWLSGGVTMPATSNGGASYRYVVSAPSGTTTQLVTVYSIGQAGTQTGQHVTSTQEAALSVCTGGCLAPSTASSCVKAPSNAVSATIVAYGAKGGAGSPYSATAAAGGTGALITATVPVTGSDILDLIPGQPGKIGNFHLLDLISLFPGAGGYGGKQAVSCSLNPPHTPPDLSGGNGDIPGGILDLSTNGGGGGGGASSVYDATSDTMLTVAGGGGGGGGPGNILALNVLGLVGLNYPPTAGGTASPTLTAPGAGSNVTTVNVLGVLKIPGAVGGSGGVWMAGASTNCATAANAGKACGQYGIAQPLAGVANGGGGGGGGGYSASGVGGGGGGATGALGACLLGILCTPALLGAVGSGAGGGAGASYPLTTCGSAPTFGTTAQYLAGDPTGVGQVGITFFAGACGTIPLTTVTGTVRAAAAP
jgi:hypothetical protein